MTMLCLHEAYGSGIVFKYPLFIARYVEQLFMHPLKNQFRDLEYFLFLAIMTLVTVLFI